MTSLAIIIPAWKKKYLHESLESIASQTNKDFHVYICDDNSPENLYEVVKQFKSRLQITYHKFSENLGKASLSAQWMRCISLSKEAWIWLFSDDDIMETDCVQQFYDTLQRAGKKFPAYRFNTKKIDAQKNVLYTNIYPDETSVNSFLASKFTYRLESYMVEYIFSREAYLKTKGIPEFPLSWAADDAFWVSLAMQENIKTINGAWVLWRSSEVNITGTNTNPTIAKAKLDTCFLFFKWLNENAHYKQPLLFARWFIKQLKTVRLALTANERWYYAKKFFIQYPFAFFAFQYSFLKYTFLPAKK